MTIIRRDKCHTNFADASQVETAANRANMQAQKPCASSFAKISLMGMAKAALTTAGVLLLPHGAQALEQATRTGTRESLPVFAESKPVQLALAGHRMRDIKNVFAHSETAPRRGLLPAPDSVAVYLVPKNTFSKTSGFQVLDGKAGIGNQTVLGSAEVSGRRVFNVQSDGQIVLDVDAGAQALCLDVFGAIYKNGAVVDLWPCNRQSNQKWNFTAKGDNYYKVSPYGEPAGSHFCLDVAGNKTADNTPIQLYGCHGGANQQWTFITSG